MNKTGNESIPVVFITDDNYAMPTAVAIASLIHNKKNSSIYHVYVLTIGVNDDNLRRLSGMSKRNVEVEIISISDNRYTNLIINNLHVSTAAIYKFELPNIFLQYDKILYIDSDMIINKDLQELFRTDISDYYAGVVKDYKATTYNPPQLNKLKIDLTHRFYFNSGMMLLNLEKLRNDNISEKLLDYRNNGINYFMDQDALNVVFNDSVVYMPFEYNMMCSIAELFSPEILSDFYEMDKYDHWHDLLKRATIIHLSGPFKPWEHLTPMLTKFYEFYYSKTTFSDLQMPLWDTMEKQDPVQCSEEITVVYLCENKTAKITAVSITSLLANRNSSSNYSVIVFGNKLTLSNTIRLNNLSDESCKVRVLDIDRYDHAKNIDMLGKSISPLIMAKFELPYLLSDCRKCIFVSSNTLVLKDLTPFYNIDIENYYAAAVPDFRAESYNPPQVKKLNLNHTHYFNTGVMLLNMKKIKEDGICEKMISYKKYGVNFFAEQDAFNVCFENNVKYISYYFNGMDNVLDIFKRNDVYKKVNVRRFATVTEFLANCYIIQFNSNNRPWEKKKPFETDLFVRYYLNSPFFDIDFNDTFTELAQEVCDKFHCPVVSEYNDEYCDNIIRRAFYPKKSIQHINFDEEQKNYVDKLLTKYADVSPNGFNQTPRDKKVIISLTTIPYRISAAALVISIMMHQTVKPDKIILYLASDEFNGLDLPELLLKEAEAGVEIIYCENLMCHKKYYYTMLNYPDDIVITVDDDLIYDENLIESLLDSYKNFPNAVSAMRLHQITFMKKNMIAPYCSWMRCSSDYINIPSYKLIATGVGGVLYPPHCLNKEVFNKEQFMKLAPRADDLWLKIMELLNGTPTVLVSRQKPLLFIDGTQEVALCSANVNENQNDEQLAQILSVYGTFEEKSVVDILLDETDAVPVKYMDVPEMKVSILQPQIDQLKRTVSELKETETRLIKELGKAKESEKVWVGRANKHKDSEMVWTERANKHKDSENIWRQRANDNAKLLNEADEKLKKANEYIVELKQDSYALSEVRKSFSYRLAMFFTWLPRKLRKKK